MDDAHDVPPNRPNEPGGRNRPTRSVALARTISGPRSGRDRSSDDPGVEGGGPSPAGDDQRQSAIPDDGRLNEMVYATARAVALGVMEPAQGRATAVILKDTIQIRKQQEPANGGRDSSAASNHRDHSSGSSPEGPGATEGRPLPGKPRLVSASIIDAMLEVAMKHQPQLIRDLEPVLDDEQLAAVDDFVGQWNVDK